jgi:phosphoglycolate phosphatase-like HAD superfamily hydrolase
MALNLADFRFAVFDVERTLINNQRVYGWILRLMPGTEESSYPCQSRTGTKLLLPRHLCHILCHFPRLTYWLDSLLLAFFNLLERLERKEPSSCEGAEEILSELTKRGYLLFASSGNYTKKVRGLLEKKGMALYFTAILGAEKIPKTGHIPYFASLIGVSVEKFGRSCLVFGDSPSDVVIAKWYGAYPIGVSNSNRTALKRIGAQEVISSLKEVII